MRAIRHQNLGLFLGILGAAAMLVLSTWTTLGALEQERETRETVLEGALNVVLEQIRVRFGVEVDIHGTVDEEGFVHVVWRPDDVTGSLAALFRDYNIMIVASGQPTRCTVLVASTKRLGGARRPVASASAS